MKPAPVVDICAACRDNTAFEYDHDTDEWLSVCCAAHPFEYDREPDDLA